MKWLPWALIVLLIFAVLCLWNRKYNLSSAVTRDTIEYIDTITFYYPVTKDSIVIRYEVVKLPAKKDTCEYNKDTCFSDSIEVEIPITSKEYKDSLYHLWISGYAVRLDSINVNARIREIKIRTPLKLKRWGVGLQVGYGYPMGGYIGVGISYNLFQW